MNGMLDDFDSVKSAPKASNDILADFDSIKPPPKKEEPRRAAAEATKAGPMVDYDAAVAHTLTGIGTSIIGGWRGLAELARGGTLDDAVKMVHGEDENAIARGYQPQDESGRRAVAAMDSPYNPMNIVGVAGKKAGEVAQDLGAGPGVATAIETGVNAVPLVLIKGGKTDVRIPTPQRSIPAQAGGEAMPSGAVPKMPANADLPPAMRPKPQAAPAAAAPAAEAPKAPAFAEEAPPAYEGKALPAAEQARRAAVLKRVGVGEARQSAIEGNGKQMATDVQESKLDTRSGDRLKEVLTGERQALADHAERIVRETGGTLGTDSQALEARGHTILQPLEAAKQWFTDQTSALYKEADARAKGQPVQLGTFQDILKTDSKFANTDTIELRKGITARMKELGLIDKEGNTLPATAKQAENLRQYVNEEWSPKSNGRIRELKNALDEDVTKAAGEDLYKKARALHAMKESIFSDPKGISSILDSEGINRKVPVERIADSIAALPNAQFAHIVKTLRNVPAELKPQADAALAEIKAHFANRLAEAGNKTAGQWNAKATSAYLNKNSAKLAQIFDEKEMAKMNDLNDAGHILRTDQSYPGAAVQEHNLVQRGAMGALRAGGAAIGGTLGGGIGAAIGDFAGAAAGKRFSEASALAKTQKRVVKLSDLPK